MSGVRELAAVLLASVFVCLVATDFVLNHSEFNESPETGTQYVLIGLEATRTGREEAALWEDTYFEFVGSEGTAFQAGFADIPEAISDTSGALTGASVSGNLVFLVSSDQVSGGTLRLSEAFSFEDVEKFFAIE